VVMAKKEKNLFRKVLTLFASLSAAGTRPTTKVAARVPRAEIPIGKMCITLNL
jgi:hypothetical protein